MRRGLGLRLSRVDVAGLCARLDWLHLNLRLDHGRCIDEGKTIPFYSLALFQQLTRDCIPTCNATTLI